MSRQVVTVIPVVAGVLLNGKKILMAKRPEGKPYSGYWELPGGKIDVNELSRAAIKRELQEELGITVREAYFWFNHCYDYPDKSVSIDLWKIIQYEGIPFGKENQVLHWATSNEISRLRLLEGNIPLVEKLRQLVDGYCKSSRIFVK